MKPKRKAEQLKNNPLISTVRTKIVWVVSITRGGYQPLAVFDNEADAFQVCKLAGMNGARPRRDAVWMPVRGKKNAPAKRAAKKSKPKAAK